MYCKAVASGRLVRCVLVPSLMRVLALSYCVPVTDRVGCLTLPTVHHQLVLTRSRHRVLHLRMALATVS